MAQKSSPEYKSLANSIAEKTESLTAARAFTEPTRQAFSTGASESDLESSLERAWNGLIVVAADTQHASQDPLVDIVRAVQQLKLTEGGDERGVTVWGERVEVWKDMPLFGPSVREAWNRAPGTDSADDFNPEQWCNINAFLARLTSLSSSVPAFDFSLYAIWTLRSAFEGTNEPAPADADAAKVWFVYAKDVIERLSQEEKIFDGKVARAGDKFSAKEWRGFSTERLEVWQAALR